ncbi:MAG: hypothetical protein ABR987_24820 [Terracidiphilus sp.]|jgi:hypothetical protein
MSQRIKPQKIHSLAKLIESETRKHLKRCGVALPPNLPAVIKAVSHAGDWLNRPIELPAGLTPPPGFLDVMRQSQAEIKATLAECLDKYPGALFAIHDCFKARRKPKNTTEKNAEFFASHREIYSYFDGQQTKHFLPGGSLRFSNGSLQFVPHNNQPPRGTPNEKIGRHELKNASHADAAALLKRAGQPATARTVEDARAKNR